MLPTLYIDSLVNVVRADTTEMGFDHEIVVDGHCLGFGWLFDQIASHINFCVMEE